MYATDDLIGRHELVLPHPFSYADRFAVHAANMLNAILEESAIGTIYRMEDITTECTDVGHAGYGAHTGEHIRPERLAAACGQERPGKCCWPP
jgi:hypothetical protein